MEIEQNGTVYVAWIGSEDLIRMAVEISLILKEVDDEEYPTLREFLHCATVEHARRGV